MKNIVNSKLLLGIILTVVLISAIYLVSGRINNSSGDKNQTKNSIFPTANEAGEQKNIDNNSIKQKESYETKTNNELEVDISIRPVNLGQAEEQWSFEISLDTHSVELNKDLVLISELVDDKDNVYKPLPWEGDPLGGHHISGILKFKPIFPKPKFVELRIKNLVEDETRSFKWEI